MASLLIMVDPINHTIYCKETNYTQILDKVTHILVTSHGSDFHYGEVYLENFAVTRYLV